jgi:hypothetical protein
MTTGFTFDVIHFDQMPQQYSYSRERKKFKGLGGRGAAINRLSVYLSITLLFLRPDLVFLGPQNLTCDP